MGPRILVYLLAIGVMSGAMVVAHAQDDTSGFDAQASQVVADITAGNFADVRGQFDPTMMGVLSEAGLANAWRTYQELLGSFQSAGQPAAVMRGDLVIEQVPVQLASSEGEIRIVFHPDGTIAGLFFLRPGVPVP